MAALNCMSTFQPITGRVDSRPPHTSAVICSPSPSSCKTGAPSLRSNFVCGIRNFQHKRISSFRLRTSASIVGQQGDSGASSRGDSTPSGASLGLVQAPRRAADIVQEFYDKINQRDYMSVANLFTVDCEYEDFNYAETTRGREEVLKFFEKVMSSFGTELKFVIDDMTRDDPNAVGVIWHLDWRGKAFPFSRGCSFYRCVVNSAGERQIRFARDIVEPATKPGDVSMVALRLVTSLFERFPQIADRL
ncbi:unnamed protein product [Calypogeia fissa]